MPIKRARRRNLTWKRKGRPVASRVPVGSPLHRVKYHLGEVSFRDSKYVVDETSIPVTRSNQAEYGRNLPWRLFIIEKERRFPWTKIDSQSGLIASTTGEELGALGMTAGLVHGIKFHEPKGRQNYIVARTRKEALLKFTDTENFPDKKLDSELSRYWDGESPRGTEVLTTDGWIQIPKTYRISKSGN